MGGVCIFSCFRAWESCALSFFIIQSVSDKFAPVTAAPGKGAEGRAGTRAVG